MGAPDFIAAEVRACNIGAYAAQLTCAIADAKHTSRGSRGGEVYMDAAREEIANIRRTLEFIESAIGLTEQSEAA